MTNGLISQLSDSKIGDMKKHDKSQKNFVMGDAL